MLLPKLGNLQKHLVWKGGISVCSEWSREPLTSWPPLTRSEERRVGESRNWGSVRERHWRKNVLIYY